MMMLDTIKTKKDFLDHLAHLNDSVDTEDDRGRPRELKSYMLEVDEPILDNLELKNYSIGIKQTNLDHVKFLRVKNHKKNLDFYLDTENPRFNILHTGELAEDADSFVRGLTSSNNHKFDSAWIPTTMLDDIAHSFNNTLWGYGIKYDDIFSEAKGVIPNESLYMTITGNSSKTVRDVIQKSTEHKHTMGYHKISIVHGKNDCGVREDIQYDGRFIIKKGNSIDEHISLLNYVCDEYSKKMEMIENKRIHMTQESHDKDSKLSGSAFEFNFTRHVNDWTKFLVKIFDSKPPFRIYGFINNVENGMYQILCVDMHTGDPLNIEIYDGVVRVYLPQHSCGNVVLRLFANMQRYFDSRMSCRQLYWD